MYLAIIPIMIMIGIMFLIVQYKKKETYQVEELDMIIRLQEAIHNIDPSLAQYKMYPGKESMTVNKKDVYLCLKNPKTHQLYPTNLMLYIALHELAHILSKSYSLTHHNDEFQRNFSMLINKACEKGYCFDNLEIPSDYCKL